MGAHMKQLIVILTVLFSLTLAGCNTVQGVGKDVEKAGEAIQRTTK
jgi:entericidin B